jgi:hypothetical protein
MKYNKLFEEVLQEAASQKLTEKLIPAQMDKLDAKIKEDPNLEKLIFTKGIDLPEPYLNLFEEVAPNALEEGDLYYLIKQSFELKLTCLFSVSNDGTYEGFIAYRVNGNEVTGIKMFSLNSKHKDFTF